MSFSLDLTGANMTTSVGGLEAFRMTPSKLRRLRGAYVSLHAYLAHQPAVASLLRLTPSQRRDRSRRLRVELLGSLRREWAFAAKDIVGSSRDPSGVRLRILASDVARLAAAPQIESIWIDAIEGFRKSHVNPDPPPHWFAVRAVVAIQVEGQERGLQALEDRIMLVRASTARKAAAKLRREWREYSRPYLNSSGQFVRWRLDSVVDIYQTFIAKSGQLCPDGDEVWSSLSKTRRLKAGLVWKPTSADFVATARRRKQK